MAFFVTRQSLCPKYEDSNTLMSCRQPETQSGHISIDFCWRACVGSGWDQSTEVEAKSILWKWKAKWDTRVRRFLWTEIQDIPIARHESVSSPGSISEIRGGTGSLEIFWSIWFFFFFFTIDTIWPARNPETKDFQFQLFVTTTHFRMLDPKWAKI